MVGDAPLDDEPLDDEPLDLGDLYADLESSATLEEQVVAEFARGSRGRLGLRRAWGLRAAAAIVMFAAGWGGAALANRDATADEGGTRQSLLLLWEGPDFETATAGLDLVAEYTEWAVATQAAGTDLSGAELAAQRTLVGAGRDAGDVPTERIGGYFIVEGDDATARRLAEGHPHVRHGGWIEIATIR